MNRKPFDHFDIFAPYYDRVIRAPDSERLRRIIDLAEDGRLLDVGGGTGRSSEIYKDSVKEIVIADSSIGMLSQAAKKKFLITVCSDSEQLPFADGTFERVIMVDALHHVKDYRRSLRELWRVLKPTGRIVIEEPDIRKFKVKCMAVLEKLALMRSHFISPMTIKENFSYPNCNVKIETDDINSWVIVDKLET